MLFILKIKNSQSFIFWEQKHELYSYSNYRFIL